MKILASGSFCRTDSHTGRRATRGAVEVGGVHEAFQRFAEFEIHLSVPKQYCSSITVSLTLIILLRLFIDISFDEMFAFFLRDVLCMIPGSEDNKEDVHLKTRTW